VLGELSYLVSYLEKYYFFLTLRGPTAHEGLMQPGGPLACLIL